MTGEQIIKALDRYIVQFRARAVTPKRHPPEKPDPLPGDALSHVYWMAIETKTFAMESPDKAMRWLCFIQGVMWTTFGSTIEEFKDDNRSAA